MEAPTRGWTSLATSGFLAISALLAVAFVAVELRHDHPLVRLGILRSASVVHANLAGAVMFGAYVSFQFVVTLYLQNALGWSPLAMALDSCPQASWSSRAWSRWARSSSASTRAW